MRINGRFLFVIGLAVAMSLAPARAQEEKETLGDKLKRFFTRPTPVATPRKRHAQTSSSPTPSPLSSSTESPGSIPSYGETPLPAPTPAESKSPETQYFEPVRPINPGPRGRTPPKVIRAPELMTTPSPSETVTPVPELTPDETSESRPVPSLPEVLSPAARTTPEASKEELEKPIPTVPETTPNAQLPAPMATITPALMEKAKTPPPTPKEVQTSAISTSDIAEAPQYSSDVRKIVETGFDLTKRNLGYKYASADPANGGLDCSGFIHYVLTKSGLSNVPRDARDQYTWVRKAGNFQAVLGHNDDTFELDGLRPGDLLFWASASGASHEPDITQIMIYVGRDKATNQRLMIGASEHSTYNGQKKSGVGVFDFKLGSAGSEEEEASSVFVGYGRFPDLSAN